MYILYKCPKNYFENKSSESAKILYFFTDLMYAKEALDGIDVLKWSTAIRPSFILEVVLEDVMTLLAYKSTLKAITAK